MARKTKSKKPVEKMMTVEQESMEMETMVSTPKSSKKGFLLVVLLLLLIGGFFFGKKVFYVASVNGEMINRLTVIKALEKQGGQKVLDSIILKALINQEAKKQKVEVSEKDIDEEIKRIEGNMVAQGQTLDAVLVQQGMTKKDLTDELRLQLMVTKMVEKNVKVTEKEVEEYLASQNQNTQENPDLAQATPTLTKVEAENTIRQQKLQEEIQKFVSGLKEKAKIKYFIKY